MNEPVFTPSPLPQIAAIFRGIKTGKHWCFGDPEYPDLSGERFEDYKAFFAQLELTLHRDSRGFVYATADDDDYKGSNLITKFVVFTAVWVDALADAGLDIGKTLFAHRLSIADLPHLNAESHRRILDQVAIRSTSDLTDMLKSLERLGLLDWDGQDRFTLRPAFHRLLDVCLIAQAPVVDRSGDSRSVTVPTSTQQNGEVSL